VGVVLQLWGPPFGGTATVDLAVIKFTILFGAARPDTSPAIGWTEFKDTFLPAVGSTQSAPTPAPAPAAGDGTPPTQTDTLITTRVAAGLVGQADGGARVDPATLSLAIATQIPSNAATLPNVPTPMPGVPDTPLGIGPMGIEAGKLAVTLGITTQRWDEQTQTWGADPTRWGATPVLGTAPAALWSNTDSSLQNPTLVQPVLTGVTLAPTASPPAATQPVALQELLSDGAPVSLAWSGVAPPTSDPFDPTTAWDTVQSTLTQPSGPIPQSALLASLGRQGLTTATTVNVDSFAAGVQELLTAPPALRLLGEER
jgi:hypothetical protein